jgi:hypothetical protein
MQRAQGHTLPGPEARVSESSELSFVNPAFVGMTNWGEKAEACAAFSRACLPSPGEAKGNGLG